MSFPRSGYYVPRADVLAQSNLHSVQVIQATGTQTPRDFRAVVAKAGGYIPARHGLQVDMNGDAESE